MTDSPENSPAPDSPAAVGNPAASFGTDARQKSFAPLNFQMPLPNIGSGMPGSIASMVPAPGAQVMIQQVQQHWQSPYPPPEHIKEYEAILPGTFDRIVTMAEEAHRAQIDSVRRAQNNLLADSQRGNYLGAAITVLAMVCSIVCVFRGAMWIAGLFLSVPVMSVGKALIESARGRHQAPSSMPDDAQPPQQVRPN